MTMLDRMRRHKGWLKWSLALVVLAFVIFYIPDFLQDPTAVSATPNEVVADVQGHQITAGQYQQRYQAQISAYLNAYGDSMNEQLLRQLGIDRQILQQMIDEQAAVAEAERQGISVSDEELVVQLLAIPAFQENGQFVGEERYEAVLRAQRPPLTKGQFEQSLRQSLMADKLRRAVTSWMSLSDAEVDREYRRRNEKVKLQVVTVAASAFRDTVTVSDDEVAAHYESHKAEYRVGERRKIKFALLDAEQIRATTTVPPADIQRSYNDNFQQYSTEPTITASHILLTTEGKDAAAVRTQADDLVAQARAGADFAELARAHTEDAGTKDAGGDLGSFGRGRMVPEFETVAFSMEPGTISDPVVTPYGIHVIKLVAKEEGTTRPLDEVRGEITETLKVTLAQRAVAARTRQLAEQIRTPGDLDRVAKEAGLTVVESGLFTRDEPVPGLGVAPQVAQEAFRLKDGEVSGAIDSPRGPAFLTVTEHAEPHIPPFEDVKERVRADLVQERATALSRERADAVAPRLAAARDFGAAAKADSLTAMDTDFIAREAAIPGVGVSPEVDAVAFTLPVGATSEPIETDAGTVIVRVTDRQDVTPESLAAARPAFAQELLSERRGTFFSVYMTQAKQKLAIRIHEDVLDRVAQR